MTPADIDRVFGRSRLRMVTGDHVEVFREASLPGERRRYTKRFLATAAGDFREWTEREWRILARLVGHGVRAVPQVVQFDRGAADRPALVQTYDAGVTVDHWATLLPLERDGVQLRNAFEDCAHWWALARHCLIALDSIHALQLVHLDLKADNVCVPIGPVDFDPLSLEQSLHARFDELALIDFAFSLVSGEPLESALPIAQQADYEYQSPRLLRALDAGRHGHLAPTRQLDWRCDLFSLAAMLWRYLPELHDTRLGAWSRARHAKARALVRRLVEAHDTELPTMRPHGELIALASEPLQHAELQESLERGWRLAVAGDVATAVWPTPVTRIAMPVVAAVAAAATATASSAAAAAPESVRAPDALRAAQDAPDVALAPDGAAPWFFGASEAEPIRIDPTDIDARARLRGERKRQRGRRIAWAGGLAAALGAAASVPVLAPEWLLPGLRTHDPKVALAPTAPPRVHDKGAKEAPASAKAGAGALPPVAPARAGADATPPVAAARAPTDSPVVTLERATVAPTPAPSAQSTAATSEPTKTANAAERSADRPARPSADDKAPARDASAPTTALTSTPGGTAKRSDEAQTVAAARPSPRPQALRTDVRSRVNSAVRSSAFAAPSKTLVARAGRASAAPPAAAAAAGGDTRSRNQLALAPAPRPRAARTWQDPAAPIPWAVAGRPATRVAVAQPTTSAHAPAASRTTAAAAPIATAATAQVAAATTTLAGAAKSAIPATTTAPIPASIATPASAGTTVASSAAPPTATPSPAATVTAAAATVAPREIAASPSPFPASRTRDAGASAPAPGADVPVDLVVRANDVMTRHVPRLAQQAERTVARVLFTAGRSDHVLENDEIRASAAAVARGPADPLAGMTLLPRDAQQLHDAARAEYARRGSTAEVLMLQVRAFGANPLDAEIAGNLAFLLLRQRPAQPEAARQLALHALTLRGARHPEGRIEDWATLAIASALSGRERDARNAFLVTLALAPNLDRHCKAALDVYALYGERLRAPVEAMLQSANASPRARQSSFCEWPPHWVVSGAR